jgi:hypothetical protein
VKIDENFLVLHHDTMRLTLDPRRGGAVRGFNWRGHAFDPAPRSGHQELAASIIARQSKYSLQYSLHQLERNKNAVTFHVN